MSLIDQELDSQELAVSSCEPVASQLTSTNDILKLTQWLSSWTTHIAGSGHSVQVPKIACSIVTPLVPSTWSYFLSTHPSQTLVEFFIRGLSQGFRIGLNNTSIKLRSAKKNMNSSLDHPLVVQEYLRKEVVEGRVAGPFREELVPHVHINRFGVIPKSHQPNKWRLIVDLSFPREHSINDGIPKDLCSMSYVTINDAIDRILSTGPGSLLAKIDIKNAFRLIPVHPADRHFLAMQWDNWIFIDTCLPFGLRSAPKLFNLMADMLAWILQEQGVTFLIHYLDDFLTIGAPSSPECQFNLNTIVTVCNALGIPLALEKVAGPATSLEFLGIMLDTDSMEARLPAEKLARTQQAVAEWLGKKNATKREILSLVGHLQHAAKVVRPGRTFVARMYATAAKVLELDYYTRLNEGFRSDLWWWHTFLHYWNGNSFLYLAAQDCWQVSIQTDASGSWGCGAFYNGAWFQWEWPDEWLSVDIMIKELVPIVLACAVWGFHLRHQVVRFQCDNSAVVAALQKGSAKDEHVMHLLRSLWFFTAFHDFSVQSAHIPGVNNCRADQLSRNNMHIFFLSNPQANQFPTPLPQPLLELVGTTRPDWTSHTFRKLFHTTIARAWPAQP